MASTPAVSIAQPLPPASRGHSLLLLLVGSIAADLGATGPDLSLMLSSFTKKSQTEWRLGWCCEGGTVFVAEWKIIWAEWVYA